MSETAVQHLQPRQPLQPSAARADGVNPERPRFLTQADCHDIAERFARFSKGGGYTFTTIVSAWSGSVRWARNLVSDAEEVRDDHILVNRRIEGGAYNDWVEINDSSDEALFAAVRRAERLAPLRRAMPSYEILPHYEPEPYDSPKLFSEATYQVDVDQRTETARQLAKSAADAGMLSAGYIEISAHSQAFLTSYGYTRYFEYTWARYSVTVRDPKGVGSGWAGVDWPDWNKIDGPKLSEIALEKCVQSRNPVAVEPGRYMAILEPQAVADFVGQLLIGQWFDPSIAPFQALDRSGNERTSALPFFKRVDPNDKSLGYSKLGERVIDQRITMSSDPMDPEVGFPPFRGVADLTYSQDPWTDFYHPVTWIQNGVLTNLGYDRQYAHVRLGQNLGQPVQGAFRMTGGDTSVAEMIATTKRGVLVTRFDRIENITEGGASLLCRGYTRDGFWLIENGKISKAIKNMQFTESVMAALNSVEQLGVPQRAFHPRGHWWWNQPQPMIVPPMKVRDFSFTALTSAI